MLPQSPVAERGSSFTDLLLEWIDAPLLLVENGVVIAANPRACQLCGRPQEGFAGIALGAAIDILYDSAERLPDSPADVEVHRIAVDGRQYQVLVMRLAPASATQESRYRRTLQANFDAYWILTPAGKFLDFSDSYAELAGYAPEALRHMAIEDVDRDHAGSEIAARLPDVVRTGFEKFEVRQEVGDSRFVDLEIRLSYMPEAGGQVVGCLRDITAVHRAETEAERARRTLDMMETCVRLARTAPSRQALLDGVCTAIVERGGYAMAWLAAHDPEKDGKVLVEAASGKYVEYLDRAQIDIEDTLLAVAPEGALHGERVAVCNDFESAEFAPWRERAMRCGFASSLSLPIGSGARVAAALNIYASQPDAFGPDEVRALAQVVESVELGLETVRTRTQREAMEQHATDWDDSFRAAFEQSLCGMVVYDLKGKILDANAEFCSRLGYTRQELLAMELKEIVAPEYVKLAAERLANIEDAGFAEFEVAYVCRDGSHHTVELSSRTYTYGESHIVLAISHELNQPVKASTRSLELAVQAARIGLFDLDLRTHKVLYSTEWKALLGYTEDEIGDDFGEWELRVHPDDVDHMLEELKAYLDQRGECYEAEFRMHHKNGTYRWMLARGAILYGDDGQPERMLGSLVDVTDRKRADEHAWQTRKLDAVARFASGLSRDVSHLLTIINGYSDLILPSLYDGDPLKQKIQAIRDAGGRATTLARQLQGLERKGPAAPRVIDMNALVGDMEATLRRLGGEGVEIVTELAAEPSTLRADPGGIARLLMDLATHARDNLADGGKLAVSVATVGTLPAHLAQPGSVGGPYVRLTVSDTGAGVDEETRLRLFDPVSSAKEPGCLRLPEVYGIVKQQGGVIAASSDAGRGTEFQVYFPAVTEDTEAEPVASVPNPQATLLVVERDPALRRFAAEALKQAGYQVVEAADAGEAVLFSESNPGTVDLVVVDLEESTMPGPELRDRLREWHPALEGVFFSDGRERSPRMVAKPFAPSDLLRVVGETLGMK